MEVSTTLSNRSSAPKPDGSADSAPSAPSASSPASQLSQLYEPIADSLAAVEQRFAAELHSPYASLVPVLRHGTQLGGKRMRPALLLLSAQATGGINEDHIVLATVIEMVHTATLVHDDVLDVAQLRRHVETVNAKWNSDTSILLGDFLFAHSFYLAATLSSTEACQWIGAAARRVCEGELRQVLGRNLIDIDQPTYIDLIRGKTAELCQVACRLGAQFAAAPAEQVAALGAFGDALGIAFQIADDYLDLWGDNDTIGKTLGTDIEQGKLTLPIIRLLETAEPSRRAAIIAALQGPTANRLQLIRPLLDDSDAADYTANTARQYRDRAIAALSGLPDTPAVASLRAMATFSIARRF